MTHALHLVPVGVSQGDAEDLAARLSRRTRAPWRVSPASAAISLPPLPGRDQADADGLLAILDEQSSDGAVAVGLTAADIAIPIFTFVFGRARQGGRAAVVSLARLDPAFYGLAPDRERLYERATAEVLHELGHVANLGHCNDASCLMSFAGSVEKVDVRGSAFCSACDALLPRWLRSSG
jgi:archaemetzincin